MLPIVDGSPRHWRLACHSRVSCGEAQPASWRPRAASPRGEELSNINRHATRGLLVDSVPLVATPANSRPLASSREKTRLPRKSRVLLPAPIRDSPSRLEKLVDRRLKHTLIDLQSLEDGGHFGFEVCFARSDHSAAGIDKPQVTRNGTTFVQPRPVGPICAIVVQRQQPAPRFLCWVSREG